MGIGAIVLVLPKVYFGSLISIALILVTTEQHTSVAMITGGCKTNASAYKALIAFSQGAHGFLIADINGQLKSLLILCNILCAGVRHRPISAAGFTRF